MKILVAKNLNKYYGKYKAINNINLEIYEGEFVAIVGPSGCGKSTLLKILAGLDKPDSGEVYILKENIYELKDNELVKFRRKNIGFVYQFYNLIPVLTAKENIVLPSLLESNSYDKKHFNNIIEVLNLEEKLNYLPNELSGGGQQRISIGRALINKPKILFADEPTGNLDSKAKKNIMNKLKEYNKNHKQTIIMVTHDWSLAKIADRIIFLRDGRIENASK